MGMLDAREPKILQQVSAVWTRAGLTERLGPVQDTLSGPQVEVLLSPVLTWVSGGRPPAQRMTKASSQKLEQGGQSECLGLTVSL